MNDHYSDIQILIPELVKFLKVCEMSGGGVAQ
jgi:hypothetical protein